MKTYSIVPEYFLISEKAKTMVSNQNGLLVPMNKTNEGVWLEPKEAAKYFKNGKGIKLKTLMDKIYSGGLIGKVKRDYTGWYVLIPYNAIERRNRIVNDQKEAA